MRHSHSYLRFSLWLYALMILCFVSTGRAQEKKASISGHVTDMGGGVLKGAQIKAQPGDASAVSDSLGQFSLTNLSAGTYTITISYSGFTSFTKSVELNAGQAFSMDAVLQLAPSNETVEVHADLQGEAEETQAQETSPDIVNVITSSVIASLPNANIADAIGRLPGVTLERDEGEGKYVQVRGTEPRLTNVTIEGVNVPSPEVAVRQVKLDVIPADLVESIELEKTLSASQDGDAIGGTVNMKLKNAGDQPTLIFNTIGGYTPILGGREVGEANVTAGQRFGHNKRFGIIFGYTYDYNGRGIDDIEPGVDPGFATPYYDSLDIREYRYQRKRWGLGGGADYRFSEDSSVYFHYLYSDFKDYGNKWVYTLNDGGAPQFTTSQRTPDQSIGSLSGGGRHVSSNFLISWDVSVSEGRELQAAGNPGATFKYSPSAPVICQFDQAATVNPYLPQFNSACTAPGSPTFDPTQYYMSEFDTSTGLTAGIALEGSISVGKNYHWGSHTGTFEFGAKIRNSHDYQDATAGVWDPNGTYLMSSFLSAFQNPNYYNKNYSIGPVTDYNSLNNFFNQNPQDFTLDVSDTHLGSDPNNYNLTERVTAGYVMNTLQFGRFRLQTGLRLEATQLDIQGFMTQTDPTTGDWASTTKTFSNRWYLDPLPSVQLRYQLTPDSDIRAVYGRGISRPDPYDLVPYVVEDQSTNPFNVSLGNPNLNPEHANDYDILYEHYLKPYGVIQGGYFFKQLSDPIYYTSSLASTTGPYAGYAITQIINGSSAHVGGIELAYLQHFGFLPGALKGFGMSANYTFTYSQASGLPGRTDTPALQRQAPTSFNIIPSYDLGRFSAHVGMSYNSAMIYQYQYTTASDSANLGVKGPAGDIYLYPHFQVDAQASFLIHKGLTFLVIGENLTNEVFGFYNGSPIYVDQREFYKPTYSFGLRWEPFGHD